MFGKIFLLSSFAILGVSCKNITGTSYFFKTNGNKEFKVYNRLHFLNHSVNDYRYNPYPANIKVVKTPQIVREPSRSFHPLFLDDEWDYQHHKNNNSDLPHFLKLFYVQRLSNPNRTNTVRVLFNINTNTNSSMIKFNLNSVKEHENISDAELYFYWPLKNTSSVYKTSVVLRLYQMINRFSNEVNGSDLGENPDVHKLFNIIYISKAQKGWQTFKINKPIDNWKHGEENLGLLLTISSYDDNNLISIFNDSNQGAFRSFAVLNIAQNETIHKIENSSATDDHCVRNHWYVEFNKLNWKHLIIRPENGFDAYDCEGRCSPRNENAINYIKMRQFNTFSVKEKTCCVPTSFSSLPIMFYDKYNNIAMKNYDNMIVKQCGCR